MKTSRTIYSLLLVGIRRNNFPNMCEIDIETIKNYSSGSVKIVLIWAHKIAYATQ
jgi:hypothetical protein